MALSGNDSEKLAQLVLRTYKEQSIWFLNAFWDSQSQEAERIWTYVHKCIDLDLEKRADGCGLDEVRAHKFLESFSETLTVLALRERLRQTGAIAQNDRPKLVPLTHYLLFRYGVDWHQLVNTKGDNSEEIKEAQRLLDQVIAALQETARQAQLVRDAEAIAKKKEAIARDQEAPFKAAQEEVDAALAAVKSQEHQRDSKTELLERQSNEGGVVQRNKAKALLAQHLAEDPLPLRKARVTLEAALKKAEKARAPFEAATKVAEEARRAAEDARRQADAAVEEAEQKVKQAEAYIEEIKRKPGTPHGAIWWVERQIQEQKRYLPERKGGVKKNV